MTKEWLHFLSPETRQVNRLISRHIQTQHRYIFVVLIPSEFVQLSHEVGVRVPSKGSCLLGFRGAGAGVWQWHGVRAWAWTWTAAS